MNYNKIVESIGNDLSNLKEKTTDEYIDALWEIDALSEDENSFPIEFQRICESAAETVKNYEFKEEHNIHPFLELNKELANNIGLDKIIIVAYLRYKYEDNNFDSSFLYINHGNELMIDVYDCADKEPKTIYEDVMQELYNFFRDASWVMEGVDVYNEKINEMKEFSKAFRL